MGYEQLWAPWRLEYVQGPKNTPNPDDASLELLPGADRECFLCQCAADAKNPARRVVHQNEHTLAVVNRYPYNNGHLLVAPRLHLACLDELSSEIQLAVSQEIGRMVRLLAAVLRPEGFNVGLNLGVAAGAGLPSHLHWHIVPRWRGDTNFMPAVAAVRVIPQSLDELWDALTDELGKQCGPACR